MSASLTHSSPAEALDSNLSNEEEPSASVDENVAINEQLSSGSEHQSSLEGKQSDSEKEDDNDNQGDVNQPMGSTDNFKYESTEAEVPLDPSPVKAGGTQEQVCIDGLHPELMVESCDGDDRSSSTSGVVTASARFKKEWSVVSSDSLSAGPLSHTTSSCNLHDSFGSSDLCSLAESCRSVPESAPESAPESVPDDVSVSDEKSTKPVASLPSYTSRRRKRSSEFDPYATKVIMTRSRFANLMKIEDDLVTSQVLTSTVQDVSESLETRPASVYPSRKDCHQNGRSMSVSSVDSASSVSSVFSLQGDSIGNTDGSR